jgi:hypothetical protein
VAKFNTDGSVNVKGVSIAVAAAESASIMGGFFIGGIPSNVSVARLHASHGSVSEDHEADVNLTATAGVTVTAGQRATIAGGLDAGYGIVATASDAGTAKIQVNSGVNINAATMTVTAGAGIGMGGGESAGYGAVAGAEGGKSSLTVNSALDITVANGFTAKLAGISRRALTPSPVAAARLHSSLTPAWI